MTVTDVHLKAHLLLLQYGEESGDTEEVQPHCIYDTTEEEEEDNGKLIKWPLH